ncbi:MAG: hypothetical protein QOE70_3386 [Chthoniobacter sp.]|jgi:type II secretory pathway pseudopilin PulG|nr:hypothetical protein [Chthoniobacter sp.]
MKQANSPASHGFSLVLSLIVLAMLSIMVVGFLSSAQLDRNTSHAFASRTSAEQAAETAVHSAMSLLRENLAQYPDSATVWEALLPATPNADGESPVVEGTMLYYADQRPPSSADVTPSVPAKRYLLPLISLGTDGNGRPLGAVPLEQKSAALGTEPWDDDNSIDLNHRRFNEDSAGWIGSPPPPLDRNPVAARPPKPFRAKWIEVKEDAAPGQRARVIARYAFWIEDESFKVNLNKLCDAQRGNEESSPGAAPLETTLSEIPYQGLLRSARAPGWTDPPRLNTIASRIFDLRKGFAGPPPPPAGRLPSGGRLLEQRAFNQLEISYPAGAETGSYKLGDETKFLATIFSGGLNLSRHGTQRLNLNGLGFDQASPSDAAIDKQIKQLVETIRFHSLKFGQRFYRLKANAPDLNKDDEVSALHENIYLYKIAANIRDYIDSDLQPTVISNHGTVFPRTAPVLALSGQSMEHWAQGKDSAPFLQEAVVRFRSSADAATRRYRLKVDYYLEFWNMTDKDVYAAPQEDATRGHLHRAFVKVADPVGWFGHGGGTPTLEADNSPPGDPETGRDVIIDLTSGVYLGTKEGEICDGTGGKPSGVLFKAGACTVITTDPDLLPDLAEGNAIGTSYSTGGKNLDNTYYCSKITGKRAFAGPIPTGCDGIWPQFRDDPRPTYQEDYGTEVIFGNALGYLDSNPFTIAMSNGPNITHLKPSSGKTERDDTYGGSLCGNGSSPSQMGDPRTNNEQLQYTRWIGDLSEPDQTRYFNPTFSDTYRFSLGWPNSRFVFPDQGYPWKDFYKVWPRTLNRTSPIVANPDKKTAPAFIANAPLLSIGQLGDIFDPARVQGTAGSLGITGARGGGRTLKIGQPDDLVDNRTVTAASRQWAAWRLVDFLSTTGQLELPGQININGLRRDNGAALRAACYGMTLHSVSRKVPAPPKPENSFATVAIPDPELDSTESTGSPPPGIPRLIKQALTRLNETDPSRPSYFAERGEVSELPLFNSAEADLLPDIKMKDAFDRTREELFRRLVELITTRGNVFSVYAVGQSILESPDAKHTRRVAGTHRVKVTFALLPRKADGSDFRVFGETFDPTQAASRETRFAKPDHYDIQLLQVSH